MLCMLENNVLYCTYYSTLQRDCTKFWKQIFPEMKLHLFCCSKTGGPILGIYKLLTDT
jgi:hypothetical protein